MISKSVVSLRLLEALEIYLGTGDVKDCFHRIIMPAWMSPYFCFPEISAGEVGLEGQWLEGVLLSRDTMVRPCPRSLPMGFSWSLYFCQESGQHQQLTRRF